MVMFSVNLRASFHYAFGWLKAGLGRGLLREGDPRICVCLSSMRDKRESSRSHGQSLLQLLGLVLGLISDLICLYQELVHFLGQLVSFLLVLQLAQLVLYRFAVALLPRHLHSSQTKQWR